MAHERTFKADPMNQTPIAKNRPSTGSNPSINERDSLIGGNKHSSTGGGQDEHRNPGALEKQGRARFGIVSGGPESVNSEETSSGEASSASQGSTLTRAGIK